MRSGCCTRRAHSIRSSAWYVYPLFARQDSQLTRTLYQNFTTFATPHLGVRQPLKGWYNYLINNLGARTLSESGRQLFTIDKFRDNNRPLLSVMAASDSIFMAGLRKFQRHTLYCNVVNDRAVSYYTAGISKTDPYDKQLDTLNVNHLPGWDGVILDPNEPYFTTSKDELTMPPKVSFGRKWAKRTPLILAGVTLLPLGVTAYLLSSVYHTCRSANRIKLHEAGRAGINIEEYRIPLWIREVRGEVERAYETLNVTQDQGHLENDEDGDDASLTSSDGNDRLQLERRKSLPAQPTLALTPDQFDMIDSLNTLPWRKYPVWIRENSHSHAVIVVRMDRDAYHEGRKVLEHWSTTEFLA